MIDSNRVRLALVGCGGFSYSLAEAVQKSEHAELATCFDIVSDRQNTCSTTYGCHQEKSFEDVLKREDIDGILLVTPNVEHAGQTLMAAQYGKHVFVEKPIANTISDGKKMIEACRKAGVVLMVGHLRRRSAGNRKAKALMESGAIGDPVMVEASVSGDGGFSLTPDKFRWCGDDTGCPGGMLMTSGIHHVDSFTYLFGPIESVSAHFNKVYISADVDDITISICQFESGILGYIGGTYASPYDNRLYIHGTKAKLLWEVPHPAPPDERHPHNNDRNTRLILFEKGKAPQDVPFTIGDPVLEEIDEFAHCIRTGDRPETDGENALEALAFIRAAIDAAKTGKRTNVKPYLE